MPPDIMHILPVVNACESTSARQQCFISHIACVTQGRAARQEASVCRNAPLPRMSCSVCFHCAAIHKNHVSSGQGGGKERMAAHWDKVGW